MVRVMTDKETKEYHLKRLYELSLKSIGQIPQLDDPNYELSQWIVFRLSQPTSWYNTYENKIGDLENWQ
jgi:hypothetical protein